MVERKELSTIDDIENLSINIKYSSQTIIEIIQKYKELIKKEVRSQLVNNHERVFNSYSDYGYRKLYVEIIILEIVNMICTKILCSEIQKREFIFDINSDYSLFKDTFNLNKEEIEKTITSIVKRIL